MLSRTAFEISKFWQAIFFVRVPQVFRGKILFFQMQHATAWTIQAIGLNLLTDN